MARQTVTTRFTTPRQFRLPVHVNAALDDLAAILAGRSPTGRATRTDAVCAAILGTLDRERQSGQKAGKKKS